MYTNPIQTNPTDQPSVIDEHLRDQIVLRSQVYRVVYVVIGALVVTVTFLLPKLSLIPRSVGEHWVWWIGAAWFFFNAYVTLFWTKTLLGSLSMIQAEHSGYYQMIRLSSFGLPLMTKTFYRWAGALWIAFGLVAISYATVLPIFGQHPSTTILGTNSDIGTTNRRIGNVNIPQAMDAGIFKGKLDQLDLVAEDMPSGYGPYTSHRSYWKDPVAMDGKGAEQFYYSTLDPDSSGSSLVIGDLFVNEFENTYYSSIFYALEKQQEKTISTFSNIPYDNFISKDSNTDTTTIWTVIMRISNVVIQLHIQLPITMGETQAQAVMTHWLNHVQNYQPGTAADVQAENASGK